MSLSKDKFLAVFLSDPGKKAEFKELPKDSIKDYEVLVKVVYTTINYKDAQVVTGTKNIVKNYPMIPGSDFIGTVVESKTKRFANGQLVMGSGFGFGEFIWGGFSQLVGAKAKHLLKVPETIDPKKLISLGNAGLTAFGCVEEIKSVLSIKSQNKPVIITGATGGVGSIALNILSKLGYVTVAYIRNDNQKALVKKLGASEVITPKELEIPEDTKLAHQRFDGAVDTVGGKPLKYIITQLSYNATAVCCGHVAGAELNTTLYPFILRAICLKGVEMVYMPVRKRLSLIKKYFNLVDFDSLAIQEIDFSQTLDYCYKLKNNLIDGRVIISMDK